MMTKQIDCFLSEQAQGSIDMLRQEPLVNAVYSIPDSPTSTRRLQAIAGCSSWAIMPWNAC